MMTAEAILLHGNTIRGRVIQFIATIHIQLTIMLEYLRMSGGTNAGMCNADQCGSGGGNKDLKISSYLFSTIR